MLSQNKTIAFYVECWGVGGIETYTLNLIKKLSERGWTTFLFAVYSISDIFENELRQLQVESHVVFPRQNPPLHKRTTVGLREWNRFLSNVKPRAVHIQTMNGIGFLYGEVAKRRGVAERVVHSHNSDVGEGNRALKRVIHCVCRTLFLSSATQRLACSDDAGRFMFGSHSFQLARNGIDISRFGFSEAGRIRLRNELGVSDHTLLIGNPSRVAPAKNPMFQLQVARRLVDWGVDFRYLMLVSAGPLNDTVESYIAENNLGDYIIRIQPRTDVEIVYSALDVMLFPSLFEGLPKAVIEAQCSGLPTVASNAVPEEACITDCLTIMSLECGENAWACAVLNASAIKRDRISYSKMIATSGYDEEEALYEVVGIYRDAS